MLKTEKLGEMDLNEVKFKIRQYLSSVYEKKEIEAFLDVSQKKDGTIVTEVDKEISLLIDRSFYQKINKDQVQLFCEESEERGELRFPSLVVDPVDGTKELAAGLEECCLSVALVPDSSLNSSGAQAWLYNPLTGFEIHSHCLFTEQKIREKPHYLGLVSRTEYEKGLYANLECASDITLAPRGSIAFKLGLLASGACDFVVSKKPKNIWDIAAGTIICQKRNIFLYNSKGRVIQWSERLKDCPLIWCHPSLIERLSPLFQL